MGRAPCCDEKLALKKGPWTPDEDHKLVRYIHEHGHGSWRALPEKAGLARCGKSCRLRWTNYLRPDIKRGRFSHDEDQMIIQLHAILGNRWSAIASHLPRRTDNEIKNYWNTHLKKRLAQMGVDPVTHKTSSAGLALSPSWTPLVSTQLTHMTQWDCALAEAEARLWKHSLIQPQTSPLLPISNALSTHPSAFFLRSWKTRVDDVTLKASFGSVKQEPRVKLDYSTPFPQPVSRPRKLLQDWDTALGRKQSGCSSSVHPGSESPWADMMRAPFINRTGFEGSADGVAFENHFSPTSILQGPEYSDQVTNSDSTSSSGSDCFEFLRHSSTEYHNFPLIPGNAASDQEQSTMSDMIPETFWQGHQEPDSLLESISEVAQSDLLIPLDFHHGEFTQFDTLCQPVCEL